MSLQRQLLVIVCTLLSIFFLFRAGFLSIQKFLVMPSSAPFVVQADMQDSTEEPQPVQIELPSIHTKLSIFPSVIVNGEWETTSKGVSWLRGWQDQQQHGLIIYGHNWKSLLGSLKKTAIGDEIILTNSDGSEAHYTVTSIFRVKPNDVAVLEMSKQQTVLVYTCIGFLDRERLVVLAELQS